MHDYNLPSFLLSSGYFTGKRKAESEVLSKYPNAGNLRRVFYRDICHVDGQVLLTKFSMTKSSISFDSNPVNITHTSLVNNILGMKSKPHVSVGIALILGYSSFFQ